MVEADAPPARATEPAMAATERADTAAILNLDLMDM